MVIIIKWRSLLHQSCHLDVVGKSLSIIWLMTSSLYVLQLTGWEVEGSGLSMSSSPVLSLYTICQYILPKLCSLTCLVRRDLTLVLRFKGRVAILKWAWQNNAEVNGNILKFIQKWIGSKNPYTLLIKWMIWEVHLYL